MLFQQGNRSIYVPVLEEALEDKIYQVICMSENISAKMRQISIWTSGERHALFLRMALIFPALPLHPELVFPILAWNLIFTNSGFLTRPIGCQLLMENRISLFMLIQPACASSESALYRRKC